MAAADTEGTQSMNPKETLVKQGFLHIQGALDGNETEALAGWYARHEENPERCYTRADRGTRSGTRPADYFVSMGKVRLHNIPDKVRDSVCESLRDALGFRGTTGDEEPYSLAPTLSGVRLLRFCPTTSTDFQPTKMESKGPVVAYGCAAGSIEFIVMKGNREENKVRVRLARGDVLVIQNSDHVSVESTPAIRHGWTKVIEQTVLIECTD